jgi:hypothetical protein
MPDDLHVLLLPRAVLVNAASNGVTRHYLRRVEAARHQRDLSIWEGEGGKLAAVAVRHGPPRTLIFSPTLPA